MQDYTNENEQWDAIKDWLRKNGLSLICIFTITLAIGLGWRYWQNYQLTQKEQASQLFDQLQATQLSNETKETAATSELITRIADELKSDYTKTPYATLSALFLAKNAVGAGDLQTAQQQLQWAVDHAPHADLHDIASVRLARVLLADKKPDQALVVLEKLETKAFAAAKSQVQGDIYVTQGDLAKARVAYQSALNALPADEPIRRYVEMQLNQLPQ